MTQIHLLQAKSIEVGRCAIICIGAEQRCAAGIMLLLELGVTEVILFRYEPLKPAARKLLDETIRLLEQNSISYTKAVLYEDDPARSVREFSQFLPLLKRAANSTNIVIDISVLNKMHLLMLLDYLDSQGLWDSISLIYSEPEDYPVSSNSPMYIGFKTIIPIVGFYPPVNPGRPLRLCVFLGYESNRAQAVYDNVPSQHVLLYISEPYQTGWIQRTENINSKLIDIVGRKNVSVVSGLDPQLVCSSLSKDIGGVGAFGETLNVVCPLGTKPQTVGAYIYYRQCVDPPAILYVQLQKRIIERGGVGVGPTWLIKGVECS